MLYDEEKKIIEKYDAVLSDIANANLLYDTEKPTKPDKGTSYMMLKEMAVKGDHTIYAGVPSDFDWDMFKKDAGL